MKLKVNYRAGRFTPTVRVALAEPRDERLQQLRERIEAEFAHLRDARGHLVKLALNEAEALAMQTSFPHLVFPTLAQEKVGAVAVWHQRQAALQRNESTLAFAA
ncbi:MAG: Uncharacterized protein FD161_3271 [Limisphaerales bacterium]|nr:MAG: Uncharacterized protein FD161_3271 [Limisphaerales bacterium]KAG0507879.1 MAG: Uncharacterized protein E1N63_2937 [Limisphaerales bacterium]TXT49976.1 MAG: Uncharacterized protein FD140_2662 [Limisphaerales bacterium]